MSTIGATGSSYTPGELASLLGNAPVSPSAAGGLAALLNPPSADGASTDGLLAALDAQSGSTGDGLTSLFGPATIVDPGIAGILDTLAQADSDADTTFDQSLPASATNAGATPRRPARWATISTSPPDRLAIAHPGRCACTHAEARC